jgi:hypothetical protein
MSFSDSDWTRDPPQRPPLPPPLPQAQRRALLLAVAIALGCVAIAFTLYGVERWLDAPQPVPAVQRPLERSAPARAASTPSVPAPRAAQAPPAPAASAPAPQASAPRADDERSQLAALEAEMRQRARESAEQAAAEAARRKQRAWERFYQRPAFCNENPTSAQMIECANDYIRMRRQFEERWGAGRP